MKMFYDVLDQQSIDNLIEIAYFETKYFLCDAVPLYQTFNNMHLKYAHVNSTNKLIETVENTYRSINNKDVKIKNFWFNLVREESNYGWHTHPNTTLVFYLLNTEGCGTIIEDENTEIAIPSQDNSMIFLPKGIVHKTPNWKGRDRISIAIDMDD